MGFNISRRYKNVSYIEPGAPDDAEPFRATIRTNLTAAEVEEIKRISDHHTERFKEIDGDTKDPEERAQRKEEAAKELNEELHRFYAPFVTKWNLEYEDEDGKIQRLDPPSECKGETFVYVPDPVLALLFRDIQRSAVERVDPKR